MSILPLYLLPLFHDMRYETINACIM